MSSPFRPGLYQVDNYSELVPYNRQSYDSEWTYGPQTPVTSQQEQLIGWGKFGLGVGAISLFGRYQFASGKRGWDYLIKGVRAVEEYSPGRIFRTFQISNLLSPLEAPSRQYRYFSPELISRLRNTPVGQEWIDHISRLTGKRITSPEIMAAGFRFEGGQLLLGQTGSDVLLKHAGVVRSPVGAGPQFQSAYARSLAGGPLAQQAEVLTQPISFLDKAGKLQQETFMFTGGSSRLQAARRYVSGYGTSLVERFNQLARTPSELPIVSDVIKRIPIIKNISLDVVPSSGLKTLGKIVGKLGIVGYAGVLAYQQLDHAVRESSLFDNTLFEEGISVAAGTLWTRGQVASSRLAEIFGLHNYREAQERFAPGSTELSRLLAFPIIGALGGLGVGYAQKIWRQVGFQKAGLSLEQASIAASARDTLFKSAIYGTEIPERLKQSLTPEAFSLIQKHTEDKLKTSSGQTARWIAQKQQKDTFLGKIARGMGKATPTRMQWVFGAIRGAALVLPFLPGALIPEKRPEELEAIYSGQELIPIRHGRYWEMGRCNASESLIKTGLLQSKKAKDILITDTLIGPNGLPCKVLGIYQRPHTGKVVKIITGLDRNIETGLTENHIVPVMKEKNSHGYHILKDCRIVQEEEAGNIEVGDFVQIPVPKLNLQDIGYIKLDLEPLIKTGQYLIIDNLIYPAQTNWFSKKIQRSRGDGIPKEINLTHRLGRLFGYFLAEGNISFKKNIPTTIETVHALGEKWIVDDIIYIVKSVFGITPTVRFKKGTKPHHEGCWIVRICSAVLARIFFELFYKSNRNNDKQIPLWFLETSRYFLNAIVLGYWRGDGHIDRGRYVISSSRKQFIDFVQVVLLSEGIVPSIPCLEKSKQINKNGKNCIRYRISWMPNSQGQSGQGYQWKNYKLFVRVIKIIHEEYDNTVYDFEIDHPDHLYQAGTFLVHNSPYKGTHVDRYRPHWYHRMRTRAKEKAIWGEDEPGPFEKWWIQNFTYDLERTHYYDRPYPVSAPAFQDIPFVGPILSATIGRLIKPPVYMHEDQWRSIGPDGESLVKRAPSQYGQHTLPGTLEGGEPISPYGPKGVIGEQIYRMQEMFGLPGFTSTAIKEHVTGRADVFDQEMQLESAGRIAGMERSWWDEERGGMWGLSEGIRRLYPHRRRQIELYNPIRNLQPNWLTGPGEKGPDLLHGDSYSKIPDGELRLPGPGYETLYPELKGTDPAEYPLLHRLSILCLKEDTLVPTKKGLKRITDISSQDLVIGENGEYQEIEQLLYREEKDDMVTIQTFYNYLPLRCSINHLILTSDKNGNVLEKKAIDITTNDYLLFPKLQFQNNLNICIGDYCNVEDVVLSYLGLSYWGKAKGSQNNIRFNLTADKRLGRIFGLYLAEGCVSTNKITWSFNVTEKDTLGQEIREFANYLGVSFHDRITSTNSYQININNKLLSRFFLALFNTGSSKKEIKIDLQQFSREFALGIIEGYFDGDGYIATTSNSSFSCRASSISFKLLAQLKIYCSGLGIVSGLNERKGKYRGQKAWTLDIQRRDISKLNFRNIQNNGKNKFKVSQSKKHNFELSSFVAIRVKKVTVNCDSGPWFDLCLKGKIHRFLTLQGIVHNSDVAPYSDKYKSTLKEARSTMSSFSEEELARFNTIVSQREQLKKRKEFSPYQWKERARTPMEEILYEADETPKPGWMKRTVGKYWETLVHNVETPLEFLTPISPGSKLVHMRTAVEDYERRQVWGTQNAFWSHPVRDFLGPFFDATKHAIGFKGIPTHVQERRDLEDYFDVLKYIKFTRLKSAATISEDTSAIKQYEGKQKRTLFGLDPFTLNPSQIYGALPRREREYFEHFQQADIEERLRIMSMIPENQQNLMMAQWKIKDATDMKQAIEKNLLTDQQVKEATKVLAEFSDERATQGLPKSQDLWAEYISTKLPGESYADWYRRTKLLEEKLGDRYLPGPDWVGWCPSVDLDDIRARIVLNEGKNTYDYDVWPDQLRSIARRPIIAQAVTELERPALDSNDLRSRITEVLNVHNIRASHIALIPNSGDNVIDLRLQQDRSRSDQQKIRKMF